MFIFIGWQFFEIAEFTFLSKDFAFKLKWVHLWKAIRSFFFKRVLLCNATMQCRYHCFRWESDLVDYQIERVMNGISCSVTQPLQFCKVMCWKLFSKQMGRFDWSQLPVSPPWILFSVELWWMYMISVKYIFSIFLFDMPLYVHAFSSRIKLF